MQSENRVKTRFSCYAHAVLKGVPGYVRDVSNSGLRITTLSPVNNESTDPFDINILSNKDLGIRDIHVSVRIRWEKKRSLYYYYGLEVVLFKTPESKDHFEALIDIYQ